LVLSRRVGESVIIDGDIKVTILNISGNQIRIGIDAPKEVTIHRKEIQDRIDRGEPLHD